MVKKFIKEAIIQEITGYKKALLNNGVKVQKLILFGSQAKGSARSYSDIDLCVISPQFGKNSFDERVMLAKMTIGVSARIEPHPYHPRDLQNRYDPLAAEIRKYGVVL
jgi:predicted nucleotidyltransferase